MPDTTSNYSQVRIVIQLPAAGTRAAWSANVTTVIKGVPRARVLEQGHVDIGARLGTPEALHESIGLVAKQLAGRYPLIDTM